MPELPEVETVVRGLDGVLPGKVVRSVAVRREKSAQSDMEPMVGKEIRAVDRVAKYIVVQFTDWDQLLIGHLKMTGQFVWRASAEKDEKIPDRLASNRRQTVEDDSSGIDVLPDESNEMASQVVGGHPSGDWVEELPSSHTRIIVHFADGSRLFFNDQRVFGWMQLMSKSKWKKKVELLPPDVVDDAFTLEYLWEQVKKTRRAIKLLILDQQKMGGMGNIYANDALWKARIKPTRTSKYVRKYEVERLHSAMKGVLERAIELGGSSYSDFVDSEGMGGSYQDEFLVYDREGERCLRDDCEGTIEKVTVGGRGTYFCPVCQA